MSKIVSVRSSEFKRKLDKSQSPAQRFYLERIIPYLFDSPIKSMFASEGPDKGKDIELEDGTIIDSKHKSWEYEDTDIRIEATNSTAPDSGNWLFRQDHITNWYLFTFGKHNDIAVAITRKSLQEFITSNISSLTPIPIKPVEGNYETLTGSFYLIKLAQLNSIKDLRFFTYGNQWRIFDNAEHIEAFGKLLQENINDKKAEVLLQNIAMFREEKDYKMAKGMTIKLWETVSAIQPFLFGRLLYESRLGSEPTVEQIERLTAGIYTIEE